MRRHHFHRDVVKKGRRLVGPKSYCAQEHDEYALEKLQVQYYLLLGFYLLLQSKFFCVKVPVDLVDLRHVVLFLLSGQEILVNKNGAKNNQHKNDQISAIVLSKSEYVQVVWVSVEFSK